MNKSHESIKNLLNCQSEFFDRLLEAKGQFREISSKAKISADMQLNKYGKSLNPLVK